MFAQPVELCHASHAIRIFITSF